MPLPAKTPRSEGHPGAGIEGTGEASQRPPGGINLKKLARVAIVGAVLGSSLFVAAAPASATCHPEKPSTCEPEYPDIQEILDRYCSLAQTDPELPQIGVCFL
jgi:hypothetical protein